MPTIAPADQDAGEVKKVFSRFVSDTTTGIRYVLGRGGLRDFILIMALLNFLFSPVLVLLPFYVQNHLGEKASWYGYLLAAMSVGSLAGFFLAGTLRLRGRTHAWTLMAGLLVGPGIFGVLGSVRVSWLSLGLTFLGGLALGLVNVSLLTRLQSSIPSELRGRVLGLLTTLSSGLTPIGMALAGWLGDVTHQNVPLLFGVTGALSVISTLSLATRKECRAFLAEP